MVGNSVPLRKLVKEKIDENIVPKSCSGRRILNVNQTC